MSGAVAFENYPTPPDLAAAVYQAALDLHWRRYQSTNGPLSVLEPGCGDTAPFLNAALATPSTTRFGCDIRPVQRAFTGVTVYGELDYLDEKACRARNNAWFSSGHWDMVITNPPFTLAVPFVERSMDLVSPFGLVVMLLQTGVEASRNRVPFWKGNPVMVKYNLVPRPSFVNGRSDAREYAAYVWPGRGLQAALRNAGRAWSEVRTLEWR